MSHGAETIGINMDIVLPKVPCDIVSVDVQDVTGRHVVNVRGRLHMNKIDKNGNLLEKTKVNFDNIEDEEEEKVVPIAD